MISTSDKTSKIKKINASVWHERERLLSVEERLLRLNERLFELEKRSGR